MILLVLENEGIDSCFQREIDSKAIEISAEKVYIVEHLLHNEEKMKELKNIVETNIITDIMFETTGLYRSSIQSFYKLLSTLPQRLTIWNYSAESTCELVRNSIEIETRQELDLFLSLKRHNYYHSTIHHELEDEPEVWELPENDLKEILADIEIGEVVEKDKLQKEELQKEELNFIMNNPTKEYVMIRKINACGSEWSELKDGDIVSILKRPSTDSSPNWGVWVKGKTEPVKLLNSDFQREYEYLGKKSLTIVNGENEYALTALGLAREIISCKRNTGIEMNPDIGMLTVKINRLFDFLSKKEYTLHEFITEELDRLEIPRRFYRDYLERQLKKYLDSHSYFKELNRMEESNLLNF